MEKFIVIHYGELWLKGRNRSQFLNRLERNIREQLASESFELRRMYDRLLVLPKRGSDVSLITSKLKNVFGIRNFEISVEAEPSLKGIVKAAEQLIKSSEAKRLRINSHRAYKQLDFTSADVVKRLINASGKLGVDPVIKGADSELNVSVTKERAFLSMEKIKCYGGLPVGSGGKAVVLLSGGIDSPVAAWYAMKRGVEPVYVHLHAFQEQEEATKGKVSDLVAILSNFCPHSRTYYVPSHLFQAKVTKHGRYELVLLKAFMLRLAERIAAKENAQLIFTGESLGQVASQTSESLNVEQQGVKLPILRPLIGMDKEEIIGKAREIGTYDKSIEPYKDVCSISSRNPKLSLDKTKVKAMLKEMSIAGLVNRSLRLAVVVDR